MEKILKQSIVRFWKRVLEMKYLVHGEINVNRLDRYYDHESIYEALNEIMIFGKAQRAWVISFWHGKEKKLGYKYWGKWQADFEVVSHPLQKEGHLYQDLDVSTMGEEFVNVEKRGFSRIINVERFFNGYSGHLHASRNLISYYGMGIRKGGDLVGGIGCDFIHPLSYRKKLEDRNTDCDWRKRERIIHEVLKRSREKIAARIKNKKCVTCNEWFLPVTNMTHMCEECNDLAERWDL